MADTLDTLRNMAQGSTLGEIQQSTGATPTTVATAQQLGAAPNASQMIGTPQQQQAAIKSAVGGKDTLAELQRTASGRAEAKAGQSTKALESLGAAKAFTGLAGKVQAATTSSIANANLALDVVANLDTSGVPKEKQAALSATLADLTKAFANNGSITGPDGKPKTTMDILEDLDTNYGLKDINSIAQLFNVNPDTLWGKVVSQLPPEVKIKDLAGFSDKLQIDAVRNMLSADEQTKFDNMSWSEAKTLINQKLNDAQINVDDLKRQASDRTLPQSTRDIALQRLRELGITGEAQAAAELETAEKLVEDADNVYIGGQAYEAKDVLQSPEAKALITDILSGAKDISALDGTPFASLKDMLLNRADKLREYFGIDAGKLDPTATSELQKVANTKADNMTKINGQLSKYGINAEAMPGLLEALGISSDMLNGYAVYNPEILTKSPAFTIIAGLPEADRSQAAFVMASPGAAELLTSGDTAILNMLKTAEGRVQLKNLAGAAAITKDITNIDTPEELNKMWDDVGLSDTIQSAIDTLQGVNTKALGGNVPPVFDSNPKDGIIDSPQNIAKNLQGKSISEINQIINSLNSANLPAIATKQKQVNDMKNTYGYDAVVKSYGTAVDNYWEQPGAENGRSSVDVAINSGMSQLAQNFFEVGPGGDILMEEIRVPSFKIFGRQQYKTVKVPKLKPEFANTPTGQEALTNYDKLNTAKNTRAAAIAKDKPARDALLAPVGVAELRTLLNAGINDPKLKKAIQDKIGMIEGFSNMIIEGIPGFSKPGAFKNIKFH